MITLNSKDIYFTTRDRRKKSKDNTFDLIQGIKCQTCGNIIYAVFKTNSKISLWDYEETSILHTRSGQHYGTFNYTFPTVETEVGDSCYESIFVELPEGQSYQTLTLKNHVLSPDKNDKSVTDKYQTGERACILSACVSLSRKIAIMTGLSMCQVQRENTKNWNWEKIDQIVKDIHTSGFREAESLGPIPIYALLIPRDRITYGYYAINGYNYK